MLAYVLSSLIACGGEAPAPTPEAPAAQPAAAPTPPPPPPAAEAAPASGPYTPTAAAQTAYDAAKAAGADKTPNPKAGNAEAIAKGKALYTNKTCVMCHGAEGRGDGPAGVALNPKPANFRHKERWDASPVGTKFWILKNGIAGSTMAPLGLSDDEAWEILAFLESDFAGK